MMNLNPKSLNERMDKTMIQVCDELNINNWPVLKPRVVNEIQSFTLMIRWLKEMREKGEMDAEQARIHIDIQKTTMRTRLMAMPGIEMRVAENILNASIDAVRKDIYEYLGWVVV